VKRLQGIVPPQFRLWVGDYRVRDFEDTVGIISVKHRREAYRLSEASTK